MGTISSSASKGQTAAQAWDEKELVRKAQSGEAAALSELYERYFDRIYRYSVLKIGSPQEAEDITQEVFLKAFREIKKYHCTGAPFASWLYRIAHNRIVDRMRQNNRRPSVELNETLAESPYLRDNPQSAVEIRSDMEQLAIAVGGLSPSQREVIALRFAADMTLAEVAGLMGKTVGTVKSLQHTAVAALRRRMTGDGQD